MKIGIKLADGSFYPIMEEGKAQEKLLDLTTVQDNQTTVQIDLYRSENGTMDDAQYVDSLEIKNMNPHPNGEPNLNLNIKLDENNELSAEIKDPETGKTSETQVTLVSRTLAERNQPVNFNIDTPSNEPENIDETTEAPSLQDPFENTIANDFEDKSVEEKDSFETSPEGIISNENSVPDISDFNFPEDNFSNEPVFDNSSVDNIPDEPVIKEETSEPVIDEPSIPENSDITDVSSDKIAEPEEPSMEDFSVDDILSQDMPLESTSLEDFNAQNNKTEEEPNDDGTSTAESLGITDTPDFDLSSFVSQPQDDKTLAEEPSDSSQNQEDFNNIEDTPQEEDFTLPEDTDATDLDTSLNLPDIDSIPDPNDSVSENLNDNIFDNSDSIDTTFEIPDFDNNKESKSSSDLSSPQAVGIGGIFDDDTDFGNIDLNDTNTDNGNDSSFNSQNGMFDNLYDKETIEGDSSKHENDDDINEKTRIPVIICIICAIICIIGALLVLFVIPSKLNLISKNQKKEVEPKTVVTQLPETTQQSTVNNDSEIKINTVTQNTEEPSVEQNTETFGQNENQAKEDTIVIAEEPEHVIPEPPAEQQKKVEDIRYKIVWGDTLWDIADAYYKNPWRYKKIARYNGIRNPDYIISGTVISIPAE